MRFAEYLTEAQASPGSATVFEQYIVDAWNVLLEDPKAEEVFSNPLFKGKEHQKFAPIAFKIARFVQKKTGSKSNMIHSGSDVVGITTEYTGFGGVDATPKTDIRTADSKFRLSMKENKQSQLLSGGKTDAYPVFKIAERRYAKTSQAIEEIEKVFTSILDRIVPPKGADKFIDVKHMKTEKGGKMGMLDAAKDQNFRKELSPEINKFLDQITFVDKEMKEGLNQKINELFNNSFEFKKQFTYEAASGAGKFSQEYAIANGFLLFSSRDGKADVEMFHNPESPVIKELSKNLKFRFRWKHGSKVVLAGDIPEKEQLYEQTFETMLYNELNEGIMDVLSNIAGWLKKFVSKIVSYVKELAKKGIDAVYNFFGMELEDVEVSW